MKTRNREVNIFSMSALDLFASALGAFILITVVLFPFFPNTGDSPERVAEVRTRMEAIKLELEKQRKENEELKTVGAELEKQRKENEELKTVGAELEKQRMTNEELKAELQKARFPHLDLVIAIDTTGSMRELINGLKYELSEMVEILTLIAPSLGVGVVGFNDRRQIPVLSVRDLTEVKSGGASLSGLQAFINSFEAGAASGDNDDAPEAVVRAIERAIEMSWRKESKKRIVVVITDAPAYSDRVRIAYSAASDFARGAGQSISGVWASNRSIEAKQFLEELSRRGNGRFVETSGSITSSILLALLKI